MLSIRGFSTLSIVHPLNSSRNFRKTRGDEIDELRRQMLFTAPSLPRMANHISLCLVEGEWPERVGVTMP